MRSFATNSPEQICPAESELLAFVGGALGGADLKRLDRHTRQCSDCQLLLTAAGAIIDSEFAPVQHLLPGSTLNDRYRVIRKLGQGGMGVVYEAEDLLLGQRLALKTLRSDLATDRRAAEHLKSEVRLARSIGHAHVCRVYDLGSHQLPSGPLHYLSMELLTGPSLRSLLQAGPLPQGRAVSVALQLLAALDAAHTAGVLHRDLKPDNVLLRSAEMAPEWHAVVTDFGLARAFPAGQRHVTASQLLAGSAPYLAPEQIDEAPLTEATDIYSFGVVLFEMLTGRLPFLARTALGTAMQRLTRPAPRPSAVCGAVDPRFDEFVLRCLAREPIRRFASAEECRRALLRLTQSRGRLRAGVAASGVRSPARLALVGVCLGMTCMSVHATQRAEAETQSVVSELSAHSGKELKVSDTPDPAWSCSTVDSSPVPVPQPIAAGSATPSALRGPAGSTRPRPLASSPRRVEHAGRDKLASVPARQLPSDLPRAKLRVDGFIDPFLR